MRHQAQREHVHGRRQIRARHVLVALHIAPPLRRAVQGVARDVLPGRRAAGEVGVVEVDELRRVEGGPFALLDEDVGRFQVAVHHVDVVQQPQAGRQRPEQHRPLFRGEGVGAVQTGGVDAFGHLVVGAARVEEVGGEHQVARAARVGPQQLHDAAVPILELPARLQPDAPARGAAGGALAGALGFQEPFEEVLLAVLLGEGPHAFAAVGVGRLADDPVPADHVARLHSRTPGMNVSYASR